MSIPGVPFAKPPAEEVECVEPTATPWRVLEDTADQRGGAAMPAGAPTATPWLAGPTLAIAGGAVLLAVVAVILAAASGSDGSVVRDGGAAIASPTGGDEGFGVAASSPREQLVVEIVGAVVRPGVYRVPPESRIGDLVDAAGGYGARVDADRASRELNLAALLHDGDQVRVPSRDDQAEGPTSVAPNSAAGTDDTGGLVDLNRATSVELEALPGIGPVTAGKILTSREEQPFGAIEELRSRKLVGEKTFESIKDLVVVR